MSEQDEIYTSKISYNGFFKFKEFYKFCYNWLAEDSGLDVYETEYSEKIDGQTKTIGFKWECTKEVTDYFQYEIKLGFKIEELSEVEINKAGVKVKTNKGKVDIKLSGSLVRDYDGKFETSSRMKIWRGIYEKWIIASRIEEFEGKLSEICDEFLGQAKAFLDLESADK